LSWVRDTPAVRYDLDIDHVVESDGAPIPDPGPAAETPDLTSDDSAVNGSRPYGTRELKDYGGAGVEPGGAFDERAAVAQVDE
jgi:hypothetical protein